VEFIELDREVERESGATIGELLQLHGQPGYRRYERKCLLSALERHPDCVIETGGGFVADPETLALLLERSRAVWLRTSPEEHMQRVIDQGDLRPMAKSKEAMKDLRAILKAREPYYGQAPLQLNTSRKSVDESFEELLDLLGLEHEA
jgi:XRE family aerobic/anaerobic benzoate catabolism transcriptional regulator